MAFAIPFVLQKNALFTQKKKRERLHLTLFFGSPSRARTYDPAVNSRMLCQLSYWGISRRNYSLTIAPSYNLGDYLSSHMVSHKVFSAVWSLTTVFGMGTGISFIQSSPKTFLYKLSTNNIVYPLDIHSFINIINMIPRPYAYINHITSFIHSTYTLYINLSIIVHSKPYNELLY